MIIKVVVGIQSCQVPNCGVTLKLHKAGIVIHLKGSFVRIPYSPYCNDADQDRISPFIIDLDLFTLKIPCAKRDTPLSIKRIGPKEPVVLDSTNIFPKE